MPPLPQNDDLKAARERARLEMGGDKIPAKQIADEKSVEEKRLMARLDMEGLERRRRREAREKEAKDKDLMRSRIDAEVKRRIGETAQKKLAEEGVKLDQQLAKEQELKQKENEFIESKGVIDQLKKEQGSSLHPLRTLQTDLAGAVQTEQLSATKIAIAEQQRGPAVYKTMEKSSSGILGKIIVSFFILLFLLAVGAGGYWYWINREQNITSPASVVQSIIYAETSQEMDTDKLPAANLVSNIANLMNTSAPAGETIDNIYFTKTVPSPDGKTNVKTLLTFSEWLKYSQSAIPADFSRFVTAYMVGLHRGTDQNSLFIVLKIDLFDNVFQELLDHENGYIQNIFQNLDGKDLVGTSTKNTFSDRLLKNLNTRVLTNDQGQMLMIYSFLDRNTLVIAQNEAALYRAYVSYNTPRPKN